MATADQEVDAIVAFLRGVGIEVVEGELPDATFLPGIAIRAGRLVVDRARLRWPGDLLHEAGHIAVTPARLRSGLNETVSMATDAAHDGEVEAIAWSYAAAKAMHLDPAVIFHDAGYRGQAAALMHTYALGIYPGIAGLEAFGMAQGRWSAGKSATPVYPAMVSWLRD
jgi:hypothetical protein